MDRIDDALLLGFSLALSALMGLWFVPVLRKLKVGQHIRAEGPASHKKKEGTPTMGGVIFILGTILSLLFYRLVTQTTPSPEEMLVLGIMVLYGLVGFLDDFRKVRKGRNLGLRAREKLVLEILFAAIFMWRFAGNSAVILPFTGKALDLGVLYGAFGVFLIVGFGNAVNLTDGLDGLAGGVVAVGLGAYYVITRSHSLAAGGDLSALVICGAGSVLGFLVHNRYPARVIMGDTGSLALGALLAALAISTKTEIVLLFVAGVPLVETISVILQVISFQLTGKRIFKMSPLHHHFELLGWKETKVVGVFWLTAVALAAVGILSMAFIPG